MHRVLWVLQVLLGIYFVITGINHFVVPDNLPAPMTWMYELSPSLHFFSGAAEILGGLGLILPGLLRIKTYFTPWAAAGLMTVMLGAAVWHLPRGETQNIVMNLVLAAVAGFVAYGRWKLSPLSAGDEPKSASASKGS
jgi:putative oxidoreductase